MKQTSKLFILFLLFSFKVTIAQITGTVYRDYNANGVRDLVAPTIEPGVNGVIVNAYDDNNSLISTTNSGNDGTYTMPYTVPVRIEFVIPAGMNCVSNSLDYTGAGVDGNNIRFVSAPTSNLNYGINAPNDFIKNTNPYVYVPIYTSGDPLGGGNSGTTTGFIGYLHNSNLTPSSSKTLPQSSLGTVWGVAYSKQAQKIFTSAFLKRQVGMGPMGSGGIYMLEPTLSSFNVTQFYDMDANGYRTRAAAGAVSYGAGSSYTITGGGTIINYNGPVDPVSGFSEGLGVIGSNVNRGLPASRTADSYDPAAFDQVGKVGLGGLEISDDGKFLFVMNLYDRKLYRLELDNAYNPTSVISVSSYSLPSVVVNNGELRPFAVTYYRNKVYVGAVASGENGGVNNYNGATDLYAFVLELNDPTGAASFTASPIMNIPLNYQKGYPIQGLNNQADKLWRPWSNNTANTFGVGEFTWGSAMLSDIGFTDRGDMILDFMDRGGHQYGYNNYKNLSTTTTVSMYDITGDILIAGKDCGTGTYTIENNGSYNSNGTILTSAGANNTQGPGNGEFFYQEIPPDNYHQETSQGAVALLRGSRKAFVTLMDPTQPFSGGTAHFSTENGISSNGVLLYDGADGTMSKANGLGDVEISGDESDIEIGNRVWKDLNKNGIQDPSEPPIAGMQVSICLQGSNIPIATVATDANGYYKFSNATGTNTANSAYNLNLNYGNQYDIKIIGIGAGLNVGSNLQNISPAPGEIQGIDNTGNTVHNNDAFIDNNIPTIPILLGQKGQNNHNYDFGFMPLVSNCVENLLSNPSFEIGTGPITYGTLFTPLDWNVANAAYPELLWNVPDSISFLILSNTSPLAYQNVPVVVGNSYELSFYSAMHDPLVNDGKVQMQYYDAGNNPIGSAVVYQITYDWETTSSLSPNPSIITIGKAPNNAAYVRVSVLYNGPSNSDYTKVDAMCLRALEPACIGNYVWNDEDKDGIQNNGEVGISGIVVTLYDNNNVVMGTTLTDAYGYYGFCTLSPGSYYLQFSLPPNYVFSTSNAGVDDELDSDVSPITGTTVLYVLSSGDSNMSVDAGIYFVQSTTASVGDYVWLDTNQDGIQNNGEVGISGVTVTLYNTLNEIVGVTITDANGFYLFTNVLPGSYTIGFSTPPGLSFTQNTGLLSNPSNSDADPQSGKTGSFVLNGGDNIRYIDAGLYSINMLNPLLGGIGDYVWYDMNQDGIQDNGESGVSGITVTLYASDGNTVLSTTTTDAYGYYVFNNLPMGDYVVGFSNLPVDYVFSIKGQGDSVRNSDADILSGKTDIIHLGAGQYNMSYDAGIYSTNVNNTNSIGDRVWHDMNQNGIQEIGEPGVGGITVTLYDVLNNVVGVTFTNGEGYYLFPNLPNGSYYVVFSNLPLGYVYSPIGQGTSDTDSDADPISGASGTIVLVGNTHITDVDAGIYNGDTKLGKGSLGDKVWYDMNGNGLQEVGEGGVGGVMVTLYASDGVTILSTTTTNALGNYIFTNLDGGSYVVGFSNLPIGFTISPKDADNAGINGEENSDVNVGSGKTDIVLLGQGEDKLSVDMGIVPPVGTAGLGNYVWIDLDQDGLQDAGEPGVPGVMVTLYDGMGNIGGTTTTDLQGEYYFVGLAPGTYSVGFSNLPQGYTFTSYDTDNIGINGGVNSDADEISGLTSSVTLLSGDFNTNIDAGIKSNIVASVGDYVWYDMNRDGIQDMSEPGIGGVLVTLYDNNNMAVASALTNSNGYYLFTNVIPGTYTMGFSQKPNGMEFTKQEIDPLSSVGSNADATTGISPIFTVLAGTHNPTIDAGLTTPLLSGLGNYVWHDVNENGLQDVGEPGVAGVLVRLYDGDGVSVLASTVTDGSGMYSFTELHEGQYKVGFSQLPPGSTRTQMVGILNDALNSDMQAGGMTETIILGAGEYNPNIDAGIYYGVPLSARNLLATAAIIESENSCNVYWYTEVETNTKDLNIERSVDGTTYEHVGTVMAKGNTTGRTSYHYIDNISGISKGNLIYYRIRLNDIDGYKRYSNVVTARMSNGENVLVYPTLFRDELTIEYMSQGKSDIELILQDASGRTIRKESYELYEGQNRLKVSNLNNVSVGHYYLRIENANAEERYTIKLQKQ